MSKLSNIISMDIKENIKTIIFKICIIFLSLCTLIWFSIFSYGILYYLYIPAVAHIKPVHLHYDMSVTRGGQVLKHPFDNITLIEEGEYEFLRGGQKYAIEVVLEMPESERNLNQGMFMIKLDMLDLSGGVVQSSHRPALLRYRSPLFKFIYTLFFIPGMLAGSVEEKQSLTIPLFEKYVEDPHRPAHFAHVEVQAQFAEVYSSSLQIHAQFTGLRYLMYYWPVTSAVVGIGGHFIFLLTTIILIWLRESMKSEDDQQEQLWSTTNTRRELRRQSKKRQHQKPMAGLSRDRTPETRSEVPSRMKKEKIEIENIPRRSASREKYQTEVSAVTKQENDEINEQFFDADLPSTSQCVTDNPNDLQPSTLRQRIKQILG